MNHEFEVLVTYIADPCCFLVNCTMDEPILVVDVGSSSVKAGFSGEDVPSYVFPATVGKATVKGMEVSLV